MGETRKKKRTGAGQPCSIPIPATASSSSSKHDFTKSREDFYEWVNGAWLEKTVIPPHFTEYSVSQELDDCITEKSLKIIKGSEMLKPLVSSVMDPEVQMNSVEYLKEILAEITFIKTPEDIFEHLFILCKRGIGGAFYLGNYNGPDKVNCLFIDSGNCGLPPDFYRDSGTMYHYRAFLKKIEAVFECEGLAKVLNTEKHMAEMSEQLYSNGKCNIRGSGLERKFPSIPWARMFQILGLEGWKKTCVYYSSPRWFRYIGKAVREIPVKYWRWYIMRCYIMNSIQFLPAPYNDAHFEFFGRIMKGQEVKIPQELQLVRIVHNYMLHDFSKMFWDEVGDPAIVPEIRRFAKSLVESAKRRIEAADWLLYKTRLAAVKKVDAMDIQTVRPSSWVSVGAPVLLEANLLKNIHNLSERNTATILGLIGTTSMIWEEGTYKVNAYYFNYKNQMIIPYASCLSPFYSEKESAAYNYGSLGSIIGHELCHGFDEEGKEYDENGDMKRWWTRKDNLHYEKRSKALVRLFSRQKVWGKHVDGFDTLSENIADLAGLGISLQALKDDLQRRRVVDPEDVKGEYREFFVAYAISWRTKSRKRLEEYSLLADPHSPAYLRVNLSVSQFDEWYAAFGVTESSKMFIKPADRIRIF